MHKKKAKILIVGDAASGKSTLAQLYAKKGYQFSSDYQMTVGAQIYSKIISLPQQKQDIELFLFDLSGHEFYESISLGVAKNPDLLMVVYDSTNEKSLANSLKWLDKIKKLNNKTNIQGVLVATKIQTKSAKQISTEKGAQYAKKVGLDFHEVSAAYNTNVQAPFIDLAKKVSRLPTTSFS